ncbi:MAG: radical SAM/SPASM domain-containing protein [Bacteroidales bacterium]|nr:radical SAM/SPASM domain-containing protein [Bacteroidales bacterium]
MPLGISIEPTNSCNLKCKECPTGMEILMRKKGKMELPLFKQAVDDLSNYLTNIIFNFQGEPFLNPSLFEMIEYASKKKIYSITSTNGHFLKKENSDKSIKSGLNKLIISLDGTTQEVYEKYRVNGSLSKVLEGVKTVVSSKKEAKSQLPKVVLQFLVTGENEHQINEAKIIASKLEVDKIVFKSAQIYDFKNGSPLIPQNPKFSRYKQQPNGTYKIKSKLKNRCWRMWSQPVITATGDVLPCCFDKDAKYKMGNLKENSFREIWHSENYLDFRKKVFSDRKSIDICKNCTEGLFKIYG